ncbi:hypothetical protein C8J40_10597 [Sphingomonas sp. PP-CC-3A-396]|nr:hypothetical protein C8J40_10597 [Sphingomonas sp. PP-CC-3A-396]
MIELILASTLASLPLPFGDAYQSADAVVRLPGDLMTLRWYWTSASRTLIWLRRKVRATFDIDPVSTKSS